MSFLPEINRCPCCDTVNIVRIKNDTNGKANPFKNLKGWKLGKRFHCRKCKEELGLFLNDTSNDRKKIVWLNSLKVEESFYDRLRILENSKNKLAKNPNDKYYQILKEIEDIKDKIRYDQIKLRIKFKIIKRGKIN